MKEFTFLTTMLIGLMAFYAKADSGEDTLRILPCRNFFNITATVVKPIFSESLSNPENNTRIQYRTVNPIRLGLAFDYRWFGIEISTHLPTFKAQNIRKGRTEGSSLRFSINSRKFWVTAMLQSYKGFYLNNNDYFYNPLSIQNPLPKRPDIINTFLQLSGFYIFNHHRFSNPAAIGQYERQLKSGGSPIVGIGYLQNRLKADSSFVPGPFQTKFTNLNEVREISSKNIYLSAGYAYNFVYQQNWFLAIYAAPGLGWYTSEEISHDKLVSRKKPDFGMRIETRAIAGYNGHRWYYGIGYTGYWNNESLISGNSLTQAFQTVRIFWGRRFRTKKRLRFLGL